MHRGNCRRAVRWESEDEEPRENNFALPNSAFTSAQFSSSLQRAVSVILARYVTCRILELAMQFRIVENVIFTLRSVVQIMYMPAANSAESVRHQRVSEHTLPKISILRIGPLQM